MARYLNARVAIISLFSVAEATTFTEGGSCEIKTMWEKHRATTRTTTKIRRGHFRTTSSTHTRMNSKNTQSRSIIILSAISFAGILIGGRP